MTHVNVWYVFIVWHLRDAMQGVVTNTRHIVTNTCNIRIYDKWHLRNDMRIIVTNTFHIVTNTWNIWYTPASCPAAAAATPYALSNRHTSPMFVCVWVDESVCMCVYAYIYIYIYIYIHNTHKYWSDAICSEQSSHKSCVWERQSGWVCVCVCVRLCIYIICICIYIYIYIYINTYI